MTGPAPAGSAHAAPAGSSFAVRVAPAAIASVEPDESPSEGSGTHGEGNMRRYILAGTIAAIVSAGIAAITTAAPASAARGTTAAPASAARPLADDTATVCAATAKAVTQGLNDFVADMGKVSTQAQQGDLNAADASVRQGGARLQALGAQLRTDARKADNATLKNAVNSLGNEFTRLGTSLKGITSLQNFDATKLDALAATMSKLCGATPSPGRSFVPLPSVRPTS